ncbi:MAG: DUF411 domain-containing protein [Gemmatimonadales bacterium]
MGHLLENGFEVNAIDVSDAELMAVKGRYGIGAELAGCHTALVGGYVLEGHVPAADIKRLLEERPQIVGLAVPGMPIGSPGMEVPGRHPEHYDVLAFDEQGNTRVYSSY